MLGRIELWINSRYFRNIYRLLISLDHFLLFIKTGYCWTFAFFDKRKLLLGFTSLICLKPEIVDYFIL